MAPRELCQHLGLNNTLVEACLQPLVEPLLERLDLFLCFEAIPPLPATSSSLQVLTSDPHLDCSGS